MIPIESPRRADAVLSLHLGQLKIEYLNLLFIYFGKRQIQFLTLKMTKGAYAIAYGFRDDQNL